MEIEKTLEIAGIGMVGVFIFMALFYLLIVALEKLLPYENERTARRSDIEETGDENQE